MYYQIEGCSVRLAGSMHLVLETAVLPGWIAEAYDWSEDVFLEADANDMKDHAFLQIGDTNKDRFPEHVWSAMASRWPANAWFGPIGCQKLWFINMVLSMAGMRLALGVENYVSQRLKQSNREPEFLESICDFAQRMDLIPQEVMTNAVVLVAGLTVEMRTKKLAETYAAWISGDAERMTAVLRDSPVFLFPEIKTALFDERNRAWMPSIVRATRQSKRTVLFVGAGHLGGTEGLLALLARTGYQVTPLLSAPHERV